MRAPETKIAAFAAKCREHGLSVTHQRLAIFETLLETRTSHPSAETIYKRVRGRYPTISFNTIYKNLEMLEELGVIQKVNLLHQGARYDMPEQPHHHFVCRHCQRIIDIFDPSFRELRKPAVKESAFQIEEWTIQWTGKCAACRSHEAEPG
ncbi:MAG: Fur family transcriptional regulator [Candidatus Binatia bacterium]